MRARKQNRSEHLSELAFHLQQRFIFTEDEWSAADPHQFKRHLDYSSEILAEARRIYCSYGLFQTLELSYKEGGLPKSPTRHLLRLALKEGFNPPVLMHTLGLWLDAFSFSGLRDTINTVYIVGDQDTNADIFGHSLAKIFQCVLTADINHFDLTQFSLCQHETKLLYFPLSMGQPPFQDPLVNTILQGRDTTVMVHGELVTIRSTKCIVRLRSYPNPQRIPTNHKQHIILHFEKETSGYAFTGHELAEYLLRIKTTMQEIDLTCKNPYGALCSTCSIDPPCETCAEAYDDLLSFAESHV